MTTMTRIEVVLDRPANDMVQEEIAKQVVHLAHGVGNATFDTTGTRLTFDAPAGAPDDLAERATAAAKKVQRSLRSLDRVVVHRTAYADAPTFRGDGHVEGIHATGPGQVALSGLPLRLFEYFDRTFRAIGDRFNASPLRTPTLIPVTTLAKCDYLRSFPHIVTFASHMPEDGALIEEFRARHQDATQLEEGANQALATPEAALSPAVCYHSYALHAGQTIPEAGYTYGVCGKCFRYEASNLTDLRRLWDFTMREIVFIGSRELVLQRRTEALELVKEFLAAHRIAAEIRTASDPFFVAPDALAKTYFQLSSDTKYEISVMLPDGGRMSTGSLNYHSDFFGRAFAVTTHEGLPMHSTCVAFGLERWIHGFLAQHGNDPKHWPDVVRNAPELAGIA